MCRASNACAALPSLSAGVCVPIRTCGVTKDAKSLVNLEPQRQILEHMSRELLDESLQSLTGREDDDARMGRFIVCELVNPQPEVRAIMFQMPNDWTFDQLIDACFVEVKTCRESSSRL